MNCMKMMVMIQRETGPLYAHLQEYCNSVEILITIQISGSPRRYSKSHDSCNSQHIVVSALTQPLLMTSLHELCK